jgi:hypothetical protein
MHFHRKNERPCAWFRSDRVFASDGRWYFSTREGIDLGPYDTPAEARMHVEALCERLRSMCPGRQSRAVVCEFIFQSCSTGKPLSPHFGPRLASIG